MPIPLYGFLQDDTVGLLILAEEGDTLQALAQKLQDAAAFGSQAETGFRWFTTAKQWPQR
jgi:hypothetical protein